MNRRAARALVTIAALTWLSSDSASRLTAQTNNCQCEIDRSYYQPMVCLDPFCYGGLEFDEFWTHSINDVDCRFDCSDIAYSWGLDGCYDGSFNCSGAGPFSFHYVVYWTFYDPNPSGGSFDTEDDTGIFMAYCGEPWSC